MFLTALNSYGISQSPPFSSFFSRVSIFKFDLILILHLCNIPKKKKIFVNTAIVWVSNKPLLHKLIFLHLFAQRLKLSQVVQHGLSCQESLRGWTLPSAQRILSLLIVSYTWLVSTSQFQHWMNVKEITLPPFNLWRYAFTLYLIQKCKNDIVELTKFVEFPQSHIPSTKLCNSYDWWFKRGQNWSCHTFEESYTGRLYFGLYTK